MDSIKIEGQYNHQDVRAKYKKYWYENKIYKWEQNEARDNTYVIDTPPPTISGHLHMGHIFSYTQADFIARFMRMYGKTVFYPMGFDDNGLPTERLVEKLKDVKATKMKREDFVALCSEVVKSSEEEFRELFKNIGLSVDWDEEYQTISPRSTAISQMSFIDLAEKNLAERRFEPVLWDISDQTALAQADIEDKERKGIMYNIAFFDESGNEHIIATTRPELLPACVAVFFHPNDERYKKLEGQKLYTPLFDVAVTLMADDKVDPEKGTGLVMCCTFGDTTDTYWWRKHKLPLRIIINKQGIISNLENLGKNEWYSRSENTAKEYCQQITGKSLKQAKEVIVDLLTQHNLIKDSKEVIQNVKCAERSGVPIEIIVTKQWFIKILDNKENFLKKARECNWFPKHMLIRIENWIEGLHWDWCISRQRFFGVPFPVWYSKRAGEEGKIILPKIEQLPVDPFKDLPEGYSKDEVEPDMDVMDTWATSSITPQLNSGSINKDKVYDDITRHSKLFPADLRPQAHEIIRTWAFYTIVKAYYHENSVPWKNLMISGWCLAADKQKMSKSKGNVVTPTSLIEEKSADVVRYWASTSRLGADTSYDENLFAIGKKLTNKLWNAAKFVSIQLADLDVNNLPKLEDAIRNNLISYDIDRWLTSRLNNVINLATKNFLNYEYCLAREIIERFFWQDFCDNYLEIVKIRSYGENSNPEGRKSAQITLYYTLNYVIRLFAPFLPFITEELYQLMYNNQNPSVHIRGNWPKEIDINLAEHENKSVELLLQILNFIRSEKADAKISLKAPVKILHIYNSNENIESLINSIKEDLVNVTNCQEIKILNDKLEGLKEQDNDLFLKAEFDSLDL